MDKPAKLWPVLLLTVFIFSLALDANLSRYRPPSPGSIYRAAAGKIWNKIDKPELPAGGRSVVSSVLLESPAPAFPLSFFRLLQPAPAIFDWHKPSSSALFLRAPPRFRHVCS